MSDLVNLQIDEKAVSVPKGTNLIEAARIAGIDVPHYCYHPHLSVPGNCRMCQVEVVGAPKLMIGCHAQVQEGMQVKTHKTSQQVKDAQSATLEFILINHPLDCTVCDQSGHCKLQDYHFDYNAKPSKFLENKEHKVKAEPLGPNVILDGERCIMCTRCIRFCDEVTKTSELGMLNRGDRSVIAINPGKELNNPLSATVVDLCPVGALTHRKWRFNTRIWYTSQVNTICPGCSTGCNVKVASRDGQVVHVKARRNSQVNKEWLCDEGRYGFDRFLPKQRLLQAKVNNQIANNQNIFTFFAKHKSKPLRVFLAPDLLLEDYFVIKKYLDLYHAGSKVVLAYKERALSEVEKVLVSPDYAANYRSAEFLGMLSENPEQNFLTAVQELKNVNEPVLFVGDRAIADLEDVGTLDAIARLTDTCAVLCDAAHALASAAKNIIPARSILEKSGIMINRNKYIQYSERVVDFPHGSDPEWRVFNEIAGRFFGKPIIEAISDRDVTLELFKSFDQFKDLNIKKIKNSSLLLG